MPATRTFHQAEQFGTHSISPPQTGPCDVHFFRDDPLTELLDPLAGDDEGIVLNEDLFDTIVVSEIFHQTEGVLRAVCATLVAKDGSITENALIGAAPRKNDGGAWPALDSRGRRSKFPGKPP